MDQRLRRLGVPLAVAVLATAAVTTATLIPERAEPSGTVASAAPGEHSRAVIAAHRGSPGLAPEETPASYRQALTEGADVLEGDVQLTADGELVLVHDDTLERTTDVETVFPERAQGLVGDFTLAEIKQLDAGSWFDERFAGQRVPTVRELLEINRGRAGLTLELKAPQNSPGVGAKLAHELHAAGLADGAVLRSGAYRVKVHSRDEAALREFHEVAPKVQLAVLTGGEMLDDATLDRLAGWTVGVFSHPRVTTAADVDRAHARGLKVISDPVDSPEQIEMALHQRYDWVVTNYPETAKRVRAGKDPFPGAGAVVVDHVFPNPSGDDMQPETGEHVTLRNTTSRPVNVGGHTVRDAASNLLRIGEGYVIQPGSLLRVYPGPGTNRPDAYYNDLTVGFLNNTGGDTVTFYSERGRALDAHSYIVP
ncbi:glycerophosphodiester phosphodiesterase family protein [Prauserella cavernicola]|uniref:Lamin tail domain-containing protein n=1 Tax=Prauserella cavernicola TaxID=2800127 RepID=A0A934V648_9PSEU|nr:glycerophosphodiester phosphodiesterase family protein [Prauserella cavernicola]MBK1785308.1 lamin tail domain-containing protein [Prauserella cavernicola]